MVSDDSFTMFISNTRGPKSDEKKNAFVVMTLANRVFFIFLNGQY